MSEQTNQVETEVLEQSSIDGDEINVIAHKVEAALLGHDRQTAIAALIALSILNLRPEFTSDNLGQAITSISEAICTLPVTEPEVVDAVKVEMN